MWSRCTCEQSPRYAASPLGCAIAKLPEDGEGTHHSLGGLTPFFIHLHQQCTTWWHRHLSLTLGYLHRSFCFWLPPTTPRELCDLCCAFTTENSWGVRARLFSCTEKKSPMIWTPESPGTIGKPFPNQAFLQLPGLVAFFPISSSEIRAKRVHSWASFRVFQCQSLSSDLPGHEIMGLPYLWFEMSPLPYLGRVTWLFRAGMMLCLRWDSSSLTWPDQQRPSSPFLLLRAFSLVNPLRLVPTYIWLLCFSNYLKFLLWEY